MILKVKRVKDDKISCPITLYSRRIALPPTREQPHCTHWGKDPEIHRVEKILTVEKDTQREKKIFLRPQKIVKTEDWINSSQS